MPGIGLRKQLQKQVLKYPLGRQVIQVNIYADLHLQPFLKSVGFFLADNYSH